MITPVYKPLEDYGIIGNLETCALVGCDGSVDWLCLPYLDSPSVFAALLDAEAGGHFRVRPASKYQSLQSYEEDTNVLKTLFATPNGDVVLTDFMPLLNTEDGPGRSLFRKIECTRGRVKLSVSMKPRFNYAREVPEFEVTENGIIFRHGQDSLFFQSRASLVVENGEAHGTISLASGESSWLLLRHSESVPLLPDDCETVLTKTKDFWAGWAEACIRDKCIAEEPLKDLVVRSSLVLKLLTSPDSGAIAAAATSSLPEKIGAGLNWDYRYAWLRDASFTDQAFFHLGHIAEARDFRRWVFSLAERVQDPSAMPILYGLRGEAIPAEYVLEHLEGYEGSAPVRVGNAAAGQRQLDIYGELLNAIYDTSRRGEEVTPEQWEIVRKIVDYVCTAWNTEDSGIWESRGAPRHYCYSKLMCWVAVDRGIRIAKEKGFEASRADWEEVREQIREALLEKGYDRDLNSFVQSFGSDRIDAAMLLIAPMGFLPPEDPRVQGTIDEVMKRLATDNGLVYRYEPPDGAPREGCFLLCSFWLIKALALSKRLDEAERVFAAVLGYVSPLGLLSEQVDPDSGRLLGNFPQAFSHIGLINSALYLGAAKGRRYEGAGLHGYPEEGPDENEPTQTGPHR